MKTALLVASCLLLAPAAVMGQTGNPATQSGGSTQLAQVGPDGKSTPLVAPAPATPACPVSMAARQGGMTQMLRARRDTPDQTRNAPGQTIHLTLGSADDAHRVVSAVIVARGLSARGRIENSTLAMGENRSDMTRRVDVSFTAVGSRTAEADVRLPDFTAVKSLRLRSITYADGSSWSMADRQACSVVPDPLMLIAGR